MAIIDVTFFKGEIAIPQLSNPAVQENVNRYINTYEPKFLEETLGYKLSKEFINGDPDLQKWVELKNGAEFIDPITNELSKWPGIKNSIAYYVYYHFRKDEAVVTTQSGDAVTKTENAYIVSSARKMTFAWNQMVNWNFIMWRFLYVNKDVYNLDDNFFYTNQYGYYKCHSNVAANINDFDL